MFEFGLLTFTSLFTVVNPLGVMPIYTSMTANLATDHARRTAIKATLVAFIVLAAFGLTGQFLFTFFAISVDSFRVVGGVIFFGIGYDMLQARLSRTKHDDETVTDYVEDISITPLGIPMIAGPGAITVTIVLMQDAANLGQQALLFGVLALVMGLTLALMLGARQVLGFLGESGSKVLMRLMGLIVMVIAVEFFVAGATPIIREMFALQ